MAQQASSNIFKTEHPCSFRNISMSRKFLMRIASNFEEQKNVSADLSDSKMQELWHLWTFKGRWLSLSGQVQWIIFPLQLILRD